MIVPIIQEELWTPVLGGLASWHPPLIPTVVVSPHPDDETLGAGGLIHFLTSNNMDVSVIAVTDGENAYEGVAGLGAVREQEQTAALARLGVTADSIHRLRLTDSSVISNETELEKILNSFCNVGTHIVAPWPGDFHPDHEACGRAAQAAASTTGARLTFYFFWTWHRGTLETINGLPLVSFPMTPDRLKAKREALECHHSQLGYPGEAPILPSTLLASMQRPYEVYLPA